MDSLKWVPAHEPLAAVGLITVNNVSVIQRLLELDSERMLRLRGSYSKSVIILLGPEEYLPWFPSALYLGQIASVSSVLIPTHLSPSLPTSWVGRAIRRKFGEGQYALDPASHNVYNVSDALAVSKNKLEELLNEAS